MSSQSSSAVGELHDLVNKRGLLVHRDDADHIDFQFVYRSLPFAVRASAGQGGSAIEVRTTLGYLPYTAEGGDRRQSAIDTLAAASRVFGSRVRLMSDMKLMLEDRRTMDGPLTPSNLMTEMVVMIAEAKPYLDALSDYLTPLGLADPSAGEPPVEVATPEA
ncbi:MAG: hypothetical protein RIC16_10090 [Rhodospirillales bacterium]